MPDDLEASTLPATDTGMVPTSERRRPWQPRWTPVYPVYGRDHIKAGQRIANAQPIDWVCPCGARLNGNKSCLKCGRVPLDMSYAKHDQPQHISHTRNSKGWKKFGKGRC
jgi:hypothetical protein